MPFSLRGLIDIEIGMVDTTPQFKLQCLVIKSDLNWDTRHRQ